MRTEKYARIYNEDLAALNCLPPTVQPHATKHIDDMITMISELIEKGNVFFDVSTYAAYGKLSGNTLDALRGAMAKATLGDVIDIHCGGVDLKFPHHENEIAQSCCANDEPKFAKYWVHNEFLNMGTEKMSKSLGNVTLVHELLKEWDGEVIRLALLKAHYRSELNWSEDLLNESQEQLDRWYRAKKLNVASGFLQANEVMVEVLQTDLAIPAYLRYISEMANEVFHGDIEDHWKAGSLVATGNLLGLLQKDPEEWFKGNASEDDQAEFDAIAMRRQTARAAKDWPAADAARDEATARGIVLEDGPDGTTWRKA